MFDCSVVIPVYNRRELIERAIGSVLLQTVAPREIIVVDDGSDDGTSDFVRSRFPRVKVLTQQRSGVSAARNLGVVESQGEWIAFLDSDDEWLPAKIQMQKQWLQNNPAIRVCHCDEIWIRKGVRINPKNRHKKHGGWIFHHCLPICVISPSAVVIHRDVFKEVGTFDETLPVCEDYDLWLRMTHRFEVGYIDQPLLKKYGGHDDQLSKAYVAMDRFRIRALVKILENCTLKSEDRRQTLETLVEKLDIYINGARKRNKHIEIADHEELLTRYVEELGTLQ